VDVFIYVLIAIVIIIILVMIIAIMTVLSQRVESSDIQCPSEPLDAATEETTEVRQARLEDRRRMEELLQEQIKMEEAAREARIRKVQETEDKRKAKADDLYKQVPEPPEPPRQPMAPPKAPPLAPPPAVIQRSMPSPPRAAPAPMKPRVWSKEDLDVQADALISSIEALPGGLPGSLSLYDPSTIANRIIKGRKKWSPDGRAIAFVQGDWYYIDPSDPDFMKHYVE